MTHTENQPKTLLEAVTYYSDNAHCVEHIKKHYWPGGEVCCVRCGSLRVKDVKNRPQFRCLDCKYDFSIRTKTIFENSPLPLSKWLAAMWLMANTKNGISSHELGRSLGVTQKTAWFLSHRIRLAMQETSPKQLTEVCEADECYVGGSRKNWSNKKRAAIPQALDHKTPVVAMVERGGKAIANVVKDAQDETIQTEVRKYVAPEAVLFTDDARAYKSLGSEYWHMSVNHSAKEYGRGMVSTNTVEGFFSLLKRTIKGTHIHVAPYHLDRYLDDQTFRYNERKSNDAGRFDVVTLQSIGRRLTWKQLTGKVV